MTIDTALATYHATNRRLRALNMAFFLESWDAETEAPARSIEARADQVGTLSEMQYELSTDKDYILAIETLYQARDTLDQVLSHEVQVAYRDLIKLRRVPKDRYIQHSTLLSKAYPAYVQAKTNNDFESFRPYLAQIVQYARDYCDWQRTDALSGYDILLDEYEPGYTTAIYDQFFDLLRTRLVPLVQRIAAIPATLQLDWTQGPWPVEGQRQYAKYLQQVMCFDPSLTTIKESEHPFTNSNGRMDVRITNHYYTEDVSSAIFSAIHEMGHGLYELQISPDLDDTMSAAGASMAMHESQSRLMENMIGRSLAFWQTHFSALQAIFPGQLQGVSAEDFYRYVNRAQCSLIRTEADELTYPLHIMVRYEIEKGLIDGSISVDDLPAVWAAKYRQYLGIDVPSDRVGVLQDVHWAGGSFGYFPTYALGSAYAAQIVDAMAQDIDINAAIRQGTVSAIADWLRTHVHTYGASQSPADILRLATGHSFDPSHYVNYLITKYSALYNL